MMNKAYRWGWMIITGSLLIACSSTNSSMAQLNYKMLTPFAVSYEKILPESVDSYRLIIVEPNHYNKGEVKALKSSGAKVLAYLSVGEVNPHRWYYATFAERGFLGKNENWGSYYLNLADPFIYNFFFDEIIPELAIRGFDGFFLDTVDAVAPYTPRANLKPQMVSMINQIHAEYPDHLIIQNAGLFLLNSTAPSLSAVLVEDVGTHYDFATDLYTLKERESYRKKVASLDDHSEKNGIPILILDFAKTTALRSQAMQRLDSLSYPYFINNIELNNIESGVSGNNY